MSERKINFLSVSRPFGLVSLLLVVGSWLLVARGDLKLGIDFAGGVEALISVPSALPVSDETLKQVAAKANLKDAEVVQYTFKQEEGGAPPKGFFIRSTSQGGALLAQAPAIRAAIDAAVGGAEKVTLWDTSDESGERVRVQFKERPERALLLGALAKAGVVGGSVMAENETRSPVFVITADDSVRLAVALAESLKAAGGAEALVKEAKVVRFEKVGATAGQQLRNSGILAVVYALIFILFYIALRFDPRYSPGAIIALFHDVSITLGVFCLTGREFNLPIIAALLAIVGYSLNDTIVVYDRIRENINEDTESLSLSSIVNLSLNDSLSRTILTSVTTFIAVLAIYAFGGGIIENFAFAMLVGVIVGTYSSIYIASPLVLMMDNYFEARAARDAEVRKALA